MIAGVYARMRRGLWPAVYLLGVIALVAAVSALVRYRGYSASEAIYLVTGLVLIWYTIETYRLRREVQLQTELQNRPFISLVLDETDRRFRLINVGKGVATNVAIADVDFTGDPDYRLRAHPITHLAPGQQGRLRWTVFHRARGREFAEMWGGEDFPDRLIVQHGAQLHVKYRPIVEREKPYETVLAVREITDEFPEPRISVIG